MQVQVPRKLPQWLGILNSLHWSSQTVGATCKNNSICKKTCVIIPYRVQSKPPILLKECINVSEFNLFLAVFFRLHQPQSSEWLLLTGM